MKKLKIKITQDGYDKILEQYIKYEVYKTEKEAEKELKKKFQITGQKKIKNIHSSKKE